MKKNIDIRFTDAELKTNQLALFIDKNLFYEYTNVNDSKIFINPVIEKSKLSKYKDVFLKHKTIIYYFDKKNLEYYLFYLCLVVEGFYKINIDKNILYLETNKIDYQFNINKLNIWKIEKVFKENSKLSITIKII